ncbi:carbohydrate ABC transporter permease [Actinokineospora xionganensis]|uniref:Carbohydrate ABC transporter permease n=1 Tax=Actinokineospora xionganensis TaxID=2684470 RepID=A0ABR7LEP7_9PSEU|nr:carbohydrate ABC transporter permease [Actinokineospora xionganensis]MBC6451186.1 carbohydrate ABC transporter permease [Actinokineospora xionganensis]
MSERAAINRGRTWPTHVVLSVGAATMLFPFAWQIILSLSTQSEATSATPTFPAAPTLDNYALVFERLPFVSQFWVSVLITVLRTAAQLVLCSMAGYAFARMRFRGRDALLAVTLSVLMVPSQVYLIPQYEIVESMQWLNTVQGVVAPGLFSAFGTFLMRQFFASLPIELEEAARLDGCNPFQVFWRVMLPLTRPGLVALAIITVLWSWNDLLWPLVVTTDGTKMPLAVGLATLQGERSTQIPLVMAASLMAMAPILILFITLQRRVIEGIAHTGIK